VTGSQMPRSDAKRVHTRLGISTPDAMIPGTPR